MELIPKLKREQRGSWGHRNISARAGTTETETRERGLQRKRGIYLGTGNNSDFFFLERVHEGARPSRINITFIRSNSKSSFFSPLIPGYVSAAEKQHLDTGEKRGLRRCSEPSLNCLWFFFILYFFSQSEITGTSYLDVQ